MIGDVWREGFPEADWRGVRTVILSEAKDLSARRARPFAEFPLSEAHGLRVTGSISKYLLRSACIFSNGACQVVSIYAFANHSPGLSEHNTPATRCEVRARDTSSLRAS